jgi:hypothetical protein
MIMSATILLDLPNELLLDVAQYIDPHGSIAMSLVCRRLRHAGQQRLVSTASVLPRNIFKLAYTLYARPDLAEKFLCLHLEILSEAEYSATCDLISTALESMEYTTRYSEIVSRKFPNFGESSKIRDPTDVVGFLTVGIVVLLTLTPNLVGILVCTNALDRLHLLSDFCRF